MAAGIIFPVTKLQTRPPDLPNGKLYHVFISYATIEPDKQFADDLYTKLQELNYKCCLHEIDFKAGHMIQENIDNCLRKSQKIIVVLSQNFKNSFWCSVEMTQCVNLHLNNMGFPPIVLKIDCCELPEQLKTYTYLSLQTLDDKMADIIQAINDLEKSAIMDVINISFVPLPCINYNQNMCQSHSPCIWPHVCARYILSNGGCDGRCGRCHSINNECLEKLRKCGFPTDRSTTILLKLYKEKCKKWLEDFPTKTISGPCFYYNDKGCFSADGACPFTHICKDWFVENCARSNCKFSHDISNPQTTRLLQKFGINTNQPDDIILCQYREKCPQYSELKSKHNTNVNYEKYFTSLRTIGKSMLWFMFGLLSYDSVTNKYST